MSRHSESNIISSILDKTTTTRVLLSKTSLLFTLFLPVLLTSQVLKAESPPIDFLNPGLNDAWYNPETDGQGFFITVFPDLGTVSLHGLLTTPPFPLRTLLPILATPAIVG